MSVSCKTVFIIVLCCVDIPINEFAHFVNLQNLSGNIFYRGKAAFAKHF
jgi:hypothetical protein